jgi:DNA-binding MarR family transcriptional regulator
MVHNGSHALSRDALILEITDRFQEIGRAHARSTMPAWLELQLTLPQFKLLVIVSRLQYPAVGLIAEHLGISESTASYLIDRLVEAGLVQRSDDPADRRRVRVRVSPSGGVLIDKLTGPGSWIDGRLRELALRDLAALHRGLGAVVDLIRESEITRTTEETHV